MDSAYTLIEECDKPSWFREGEASCGAEIDFAAAPKSGSAGASPLGFTASFGLVS